MKYIVIREFSINEKEFPVGMKIDTYTNMKDYLQVGLTDEGELHMVALDKFIIANTIKSTAFHNWFNERHTGEFTIGLDNEKRKIGTTDIYQYLTEELKIPWDEIQELVQ